MFKLAAGMLVTLILSVTACATEFQKGMGMGIQHITLWQLIERLAAQPSLSPGKIQQVLPTNFSERLRYPNTLFYEGGSLHLADHITIEAIDLRVRLTDETQGMVLLDITGACVALEQVEVHYPDLVPTDVPRGRSLEEKTYWTTYPLWGKLSFGFKERNPNCLASVVIDRIP